jgi:peroxiredoxin
MRNVMRLLTISFLTLFLCLSLSAGDVPRQAPPLKFTTIDGQSMSMEDLKGKVVAVMFFQTTCPHCQNTTQILNPIYQRLKDKGLEIVGLAINESAVTDIEGFRQKFGARFPLVVSSRFECARFAGLSLMAKFFVPYMLFVDRNGQIRYEHQGGDKAFFNNQAQNIQSELETLLNEPAKKTS